MWINKIPIPTVLIWNDVSVVAEQMTRKVDGSDVATGKALSALKHFSPLQKDLGRCFAVN